MLTSNGHGRGWGNPAQTFQRATLLVGLFIFNCYSMFYFPELIFHIQGWELRELQLYSIGRWRGWKEEVRTCGVGGAGSSWADFSGGRKRSFRKPDLTDLACRGKKKTSCVQSFSFLIKEISSWVVDLLAGGIVTLRVKRLMKVSLEGGFSNRFFRGLLNSWIINLSTFWNKDGL